MGFFEDVLEAGTVFDWVTPLTTITHSATGNDFTFMVSDSAGMTARQVTDLLRSRGIRTRGHMVVNGQAMFTVPKNQRRYAEDLMRGRGVSFT